MRSIFFGSGFPRYFCDKKPPNRDLHISRLKKSPEHANVFQKGMNLLGEKNKALNSNAFYTTRIFQWPLIPSTEQDLFCNADCIRRILSFWTALNQIIESILICKPAVPWYRNRSCCFRFIRGDQASTEGNNSINYYTFWNFGTGRGHRSWHTHHCKVPKRSAMDGDGTLIHMHMCSMPGNPRPKLVYYTFWNFRTMRCA